MRGASSAGYLKRSWFLRMSSEGYLSSTQMTQIIWLCADKKKEGNDFDF
jgi:hypothetical protein